MWKSLLVITLCASARVFAQADGGAAPTTPGAESDDVRREIDRKVEAAKKEMREEMRAQLATQSAAQGWQEEWVEQNRKLELFEINGYFRMRPDLFNHFDMNRLPDSQGYTLWPLSPFNDHTAIGANMRLRLEPTLNVSEEVRVKMQLDVFDNLILGSTPDYAFVEQQRIQFGVLSNSQASPSAGFNSSIDSIAVKRVWAEVSTPVGILRFGRMGQHWGLGILHNDGNCLDCDHGETVDRVQFVAEPITGWYVAPAFDWNIAGLTTTQAGYQTNIPYVLSDSDQALSFVLAVARRDTDQQAKAKLENNQAVINYGVHFTYRLQHTDAVAFYNSPYGTFPSTLIPGAAPAVGNQNPGTFNYGPNSQGSIYSELNTNGGIVRQANLYLPDVWFKYERKDFRIETEIASILGGFKDAGGNSVSVTQFGGAVQGEYRLLDGSLKLMLELGYASGNNSPGLGVFPNRGQALLGSIGGSQCGTQGTVGVICPLNTSINNFSFAQDYRIDDILYRELLGNITNSLYAKPTARYTVADGFDLFATLIASRAQYQISTPSTTDPYLGIEVNAGAKYETEDGFFAQLTYAILFPLGGLGNFNNTTAPGLTQAQALRALVGIKF
jgi:hypothetical protein